MFNVPLGVPLAAADLGILDVQFSQRSRQDRVGCGRGPLAQATASPSASTVRTNKFPYAWRFSPRLMAMAGAFLSSFRQDCPKVPSTSMMPPTLHNRSTFCLLCSSWTIFEMRTQYTWC